MKKYIVYALLAVTSICGLAYADLAVKQNGVQFGVAGAINNAGGINWSFDGFNYTVNGVNWQNVTLIAQNSTGVNWQSLDPNTGAVNWVVISNGATAANIVCWKSNGQLGKCTTSVSGVGCTACN